MMTTLTPEFLKALAEKQQGPEPTSVKPALQPPTEEIVSSPLKYVKPPKNGVYIKKNYSGKIISKVTYKEGKMEGLMITYAPDGINIQKVTPYHNGVIHGLEKAIYPNGQLECVTPYKEGKKEGTIFIYDEEGKIISTSFYMNDKPQGVTEVFGSDGILIATITYTNGILNGPTTEYTKGIPSKINIYDNGQLVEIQTCNTQGEIAQIQKIVPTALF